MFESLTLQVFLNSVGLVVVGAMFCLALLWGYGEITYLKNKMKNLK